MGTLAIFGMCLLGGAFFSAHVLPHWARPLAEIVPTRFAFLAARGALFGGEWISPTLVLAGMAVGLGAASLLLFSSRFVTRCVVERSTSTDADAAYGFRWTGLSDEALAVRDSAAWPVVSVQRTVSDDCGALEVDRVARTQPPFRRSPHSCAWIGRACASRSGRPTRFRSAM